MQINYSKTLICILCLFFIGQSTFYAQQFQWLKLVGGTNEVDIRAINQKGAYVYITGGYVGTTTFGSVSLTSVSTVTSTLGSDIFLAKYDTLGNVIWAKSFGGKGRNIGEKIIVDSNGDVFLYGFSADSSRFGSLFLQSNAQRRDQFIAKVNSIGQAVWVKNIGISTDLYAISFYGLEDHTSSVVLSDNGNLYLSSNFSSAINYDQSSTLMSCYDCSYLFKIDKLTGILLTNRLIGAPLGGLFLDRSKLGSMTVDKDESIVLSGFYYNTFQVGGSTIVTNNNNPSMYVVKIDSSNAVQWLRSSVKAPLNFQPNYNALPRDVKVDQYANIYIAGNYENAFQYDTITTPLIDDVDPFLMKLAPNGDIIYLKTFQSDTASQSSFDRINGIAIDQKTNVFAVGSFANRLKVEGQLLNSYGARDGFVLKLDTNGDKLWALNIGGGSNDYAYSVSIAPKGSAFVAGNYRGLSSFGSTVVNSINGIDNGYLFKIGDCGKRKPSINPLGDTTFCSPGSVQLLTQNGIGFQYQWLKNGGILPGETFSNYLAVNSGLYSVIVNGNGCVDTSKVVQITEGTAPAMVSLSLSDSICKNDAPIALIGGNPTGGTYSGLGVINNQFFPSLGLTGSNQIKYKVDTNGCADSAFSTIHVFNTPTPQINGLGLVCSNANGVTYTSSSTSGLNVLWTITGGSLISGQGTNSISVNWGNAGVGIITLQETNQDGCTAVSTDTIDIVDQQFVGQISGSDLVCSNNLSQTYLINTPSLFYNWSIIGGSIISGQGSSSVNVLWSGASQGVISVRLFNSCGNDSIFHDTVFVLSSPTPNIFAGDVCLGDTSVVRANVTGNSFLWVIDSTGTIVSGQGTPKIKIIWNTPGNNRIQLIETNLSNCTDSAYSIIQVLPDLVTTNTVSICQGDSLQFGGAVIKQSGIYSDTLTSVGGCDSISNLDLVLLPVAFSTLNQSVCNGAAYNFNGRLINASGNYQDTLTAINGCDSIVELNLSILPSIDTIINVSICQNSNFNFGSQVITNAGIYFDTLTAINGCDSIITLNLSIIPLQGQSMNDTICFGTSYNFNGQVLTNSGTYIDTLVGTNLCDSIVTLSLIVSNQITSVTFDSICSGVSYDFGGNQYSQSGMYYDTLLAIDGCDSISVLSLNVQSSTLTNEIVSICNGLVYNFNGQILNSSGNYIDTVSTADGCDSIIDLSLTILPPIIDSIMVNICDGLDYNFNGRLLNQTGVYLDTLISSSGCDSVQQLNLIVQPIPNDTIRATICQGDFYLFNGVSIFQAGNYVDTLLASTSCDSIVSLVLNVDTTDASISRLGLVLTANQAGSSYQWLMCSSGGYLPIVGETSQSLYVTQNGSYAVEVTRNNCSDTSSSCIMILSVGYEEFVRDERRFSVYPNPSQGEINISFNENKMGPITIYNSSGQIVDQVVPKSNSFKLNLSSYSKGIYLLKFKNELEKIILIE